MYTESELTKKKVVELKEIAQVESVDVKNLKKAEIIESLLEHFNIVETETLDESETIIDTSTSEDTEISDEPVVDQISTDIIESESISEKPITIHRIPWFVHLDNKKMLYKTPDLDSFICSISGPIKVLAETDTALHVSTIISGRGLIKGYISK